MENRTLSIPLFAVCGVLLVLVCVSIFRSVTGGLQDQLEQQQAQLDRQSAINSTSGGLDRKRPDENDAGHLAHVEWLKSRLDERASEVDRLTAERDALRSRLEESQALGTDLLAQLLQPETTARPAGSNPSPSAASTAPSGAQTSSQSGEMSPAEQLAAERARFDAELERIQNELERGLAIMFEERWLVQNALSGALIDTGEAGVPALVELLMNERAEVRVWAAYVLGEIGPPAVSAAPALREALSDPNESVRVQAAQALQALYPEGGDD